MRRDRDALVKCLRASERRLRLAALSLIAESDYWHANERFAAEALRLAFEDSDPAIRGAALESLLSMKQCVDDSTGFLRKLLEEIFPRAPSDLVAAALRESREREAVAYQGMRKMWEDDAGPHASRMLESRASAESYLVHPDPRVRRGALLVLSIHWKPNKAFGESCESLVRKDADPKVRSLAMACLAECYSGTDDRRVGAFAAQVLYDASSTVDVRVAAYHALFIVRGRPLLASLPPGSAEFRFPADVDWSFVESFLRDE
jgi:hypothetical protein